MPGASATYEGEDVEVTFSATPVSCDYGVPGSPTWVEFEDVEVEEVLILGVKVSIEALPADLVAEIRALANGRQFVEDD